MCKSQCLLPAGVLLIGPTPFEVNWIFQELPHVTF